MIGSWADERSLRSTWISLSSSVIIFNKWILDTAGFRFREYSCHLLLSARFYFGTAAAPPLSEPKLTMVATTSHLPDDMALALRDHHDSAHGSVYHHARLSQEGSHDRSRLPPCHRPDRLHVLALADLR